MFNKTNYKKIFLSMILLVIVGAFLVPQKTSAADLISTISCATAGVGCQAAGDVVVELAKSVANVFLGLTSYLVYASGYALNVSIKLTLGINEIVKNTPVIDNLWIVIRNISSILIIFFLLYTSIMTIVDGGTGKVKELVGKIILAGLLINFSLFFTKAMIDASNLVSMQFYNAIAPASDRGDGGLSDVFMGALKIQKIYDPIESGVGSALKTTNMSVSILIGMVGGIIMMIFASISFLGAAVAIAIRTGVLIFLMATSPVWFLGMIFPEIKKRVSGEWWGLLTNQLLFLPLYLLLTYLAMTLISDSGFMSFIQSKTGVGGDGSFVAKQAGIIIQYAVAIMFITFPLLAAAKFGAMGTKFAEGMTEGFKKKIYGAPGNAGGWFGQRTLGRLAKYSQDKVASNAFLRRNPFIATTVNNTLGGVASTTFGGTKGGYADRYKKTVEAKQKYLEKSIKLSDKEKTNVVSAGLQDWKDKDEKLKTAYETADKIAKNAMMNDEARRTARKKAVDLKAEIDARKKAFDEDKQNKYLEEEALNEEKERIAKDMEKNTLVGKVFGTNAIRKDAADAFRKEANKPEEKKMLKTLKEMLEKEKKGGEKESEKPSGEDKKGS